MGYKFGTSDVDNMMFGTEQVDKIYMGSTLVWEHAIAPDHEWNFDTGLEGWTGASWNSSGHATMGGALSMNSPLITAHTNYNVKLMFNNNFGGAGAITSVSVNVFGNTVTVDTQHTYDTNWHLLEFNGVNNGGDSTAKLVITVPFGGDFNNPSFDDIQMFII